MARVELVMPKMGESIMEATILKWRKKPGDSVELDEPVLDIATDKVDSEVPSPVAGTLVEILFQENDVVAINKAIAIIETEAGAAASAGSSAVTTVATDTPSAPQVPYVPQVATAAVQSSSDRFYSPLVRTIAREEGVSQQELDAIPGSGQDGRVTKKDILAHVASRGKGTAVPAAPQAPVTPVAQPAPSIPAPPAVSVYGNVEIV
jgi:2-oxoglutarate dehydrogenase E2 component (dihydrolipoamide succinyltransferase)